MLLAISQCIEIFLLLGDASFTMIMVFQVLQFLGSLSSCHLPKSTLAVVCGMLQIHETRLNANTVNLTRAAGVMSLVGGTSAVSTTGRCGPISARRCRLTLVNHPQEAAAGLEKFVQPPARCLVMLRMQGRPNLHYVLQCYKVVVPYVAPSP